jgi:hypothetical protein
MDTADEDILMSTAHAALHGSGNSNTQTKDDLGDMTFCMSNYAKEALKMMYMMRQVGNEQHKVDKTEMFLKNHPVLATILPEKQSFLISNLIC